LSIDRNDEDSNDVVEAVNEDDVEQGDEEQTVAEPEPSVSDLWLICYSLASGCLTKTGFCHIAPHIYAVSSTYALQ